MDEVGWREFLGQFLAQFDRVLFDLERGDLIDKKTMILADRIEYNDKTASEAK